MPEPQPQPEPQKPEPGIFVIAGRNFRILQQATIEHDIYMMRVCKSAGLTTLKQGANEPGEEFAVRAHGMVLESGQSLPLLGGILLPMELADIDWTGRVARETVEFLRKITGDEDKRRMHTALVQFTAFFVAGLLSSDPFRFASDQLRNAKAQPALATTRA